MVDSVAVHYKGGFTHFPFKVPSAVANIVAIWKTHEPKNAMNKSRGHASQGAGDNIMMEIRWFYRKNELPGSCKAVSAFLTLQPGIWNTKRFRNRPHAGMRCNEPSCPCKVA